MTTTVETKEVNITTQTTVKKKRKKIVSLDAKKARAGWLFILPFLIGFVVIYLPMLYDSIKLSFCEIYNVPKQAGYVLTFVGWENYYQALFVDPDFVQTLLSGLGTMAFEIPMILIFSLFMAVMLNQKATGRAVFRAIFFIPVILSTGIMESISASDSLSDYMDSADGIDDGTGGSTANDIVSVMDFEFLFSNMKVGKELVTYVTQAINNIYGIVNRSGVQMLIFLAGLQSISPAIYESCKIDGATAWETFWKITFPMISPMILVNGVYTIIDAFTTGDNAVMSFISSEYTTSSVISTAMAWVYFLIVIAVVAILALIISSFVFYDRRND